MSKQRIILGMLVLLAITMGFQNCSPMHVEGEGSLGSLGSASSVEAFKTTLYPTINMNCAACHGSNQAPMFAVFNHQASHDTLISNGLVNLSNPASSRIVQKISGGHQGFGSQLAGTLQGNIADWAQALSGSAGDPGNIPVPGGNTELTATFQSIYSKILMPKCIACHQTGNAKGSVRYDTYAATLLSVSPGRPSSSELYTEVFSGSMPESAPRLSSAEVQAISDWITAGALNN